MTTREQLYERMSAEYTDFINELKTLPPVEIIENSYAKVFKGDILSCIQDEDFDEEQLKVFLTSKSPLDEFYQKELWNRQIAEKIVELGYQKEIIRADCANPKDISELKTYYKIYRIIASRKGKNSIMNGIGFIQNYHLVIHPRCKNFIYEIENYVYKKDSKTNENINEPEDSNNHLMDAMRYALEPYILGSSVRFI